MLFFSFLVVVDAHLLEDDTEKILNIFLHASNSVACLIDIFISARPWKVFHFVYAMTFGFYYASFSIIYWGGGGVGICYASKEECPYDGQYCTVQKGEHWCDPFIYPILDWQNHALIAIGVILGGCLVVPFVHFFWIGLAWIRHHIYSKTLKKPTDLPTTVNR